MSQYNTSEFKPSDFLISGKDVLCAWGVALAASSVIFTALSLS